MSKLTAHLDLDAFKYSIASVGEDRSIIAVHKTSGREKEFKTRTEFWGHHKKKASGWLSTLNEKRALKDLEPFKPEDFEIIDKQQVKDEPIANILHSVKQSVDAAVKASKADRVQYYIGKGDSFRVDLSTLLEYKGNRKDTLKPLLFNDVVEYMEKKFKPEVVTHLEVDDVINMNAYGKEDHFCILLDKDGYGAGSKLFNFTLPQEGIVSTNCFGKLWIDDSGKTKKVRGYGRMFKMWQCCGLDDSDNYRANCMSDIEWGEMSAYHALSGCNNDKELLEASASIFKNLYPEPKIVTGWRGDQIEIDWLYVFQECLNMCHMLRWEGDRVVVSDVLTKMGVL